MNHDPMMSARGPIEWPEGSLFSRARARDPQTSKDAARSIEQSDAVNTLLLALTREYRLAGSDGLTDEEAAQRTGIDGAWKRCSDLRRLGVITPTGTRRKATSGRWQQVCAYKGDEQ